VRRFAERTATERPEGDNFRFRDHEPSSATSTTHGCDPRHGTFGYGISIAAAHRRKGYAAEAIAIVLRYYFEELRYQKVSVQIYSFNEPSITCTSVSASSRKGGSAG